MRSYNAVNLAALPPPDIIEVLDPEREYQRLKAEFLSHFSSDHPVHAALDLESEPINKLLQVLAYRYTLKINQINEKARGLMLAFARGADLDHLGATYYRLGRKLIQAEDRAAIPPKQAIYETDDAYRHRLVLSMEALTQAGSAGSYEFHALSASSEVYSVSVHSPAPTEVDVYLAGPPTGDILAQKIAALPPLLNAIDSVHQALTADEVRPLTDWVRVSAAIPVGYEIQATLYVQNGISPNLVKSQALAALRAYLQSAYRPNERIYTSRIIGALDVSGVSRVVLHKPESDLLPQIGQLCVCEGCDIMAHAENYR